MTDLALMVRNLTIKLKIEKKPYTVVQSLNFDLKKGQTLALVGESGCGKSMTALSILRILPKPPALDPEGEIIYRGQNLLALKESEMRTIRGKSIAMIFQDPMTALNPVYTIGAQLSEVVWTHLGVEGDQAATFVLKALEDVHLPNPKKVMTLYPHQLSGGMLQRAMIAMALICEPDILIADEPTTALDVTIQTQILQLLKELQEKKGMATLLITHDMSVVAQNADEVIVMYAGDHLEQGSVHSLFNHPAHPYTQALFAARPDPALRKAKLAALSGNVPRITHMPEGCRFHPRCKYAMEMCKSGKTPHFNLKDEGHTTKCWLYDKELDSKLMIHEPTTLFE